jgi:alpha-D-ribose 1-methylphosphonate 5-triphosphate diphosphatase
MSRELVVTNARVVTRCESFVGTMLALDGEIVEIAQGRTAVAGAEDFDGDLLLPGLVELHTDVLERHLAPRPGVQWPPLAAVLAYDAQLAVAGITTVLDSLAVGYLIDSGQRPRDPRPLVEAVCAAQALGALRADHHLHLRCEVSTEAVVRDFEPFVENPIVRLVSLMDHAPGQRQFVSVEKYREYNQGRYGLTDTEMDALVEQRLADHARYGQTHRAEITRLCQKHGLRLASHDDATAAHVESSRSSPPPWKRRRRRGRGGSPSWSGRPTSSAAGHTPATCPRPGSRRWGWSTFSRPTMSPQPPSTAPGSSMPATASPSPRPWPR